MTPISDLTADAPTQSRPWHALSASEAEALLATGPDGLSGVEAQRRLELYGPNEVEDEGEDPWWVFFLRQFRDPLIYILLIAAAVTLALGIHTDAAVILAIVVINAIVGFIQEHQAQRSMRALARLSAPGAEVVRGGVALEIARRDVVPGDLVLVASGTQVPADLRLVEVQDLEVDESALTGESVPVRKSTEVLREENLVPGDQRNMAFLGTLVTRGRGRGITVRTGEATELGRVAAAVRALGPTETPLQKKIERFGKQVGLAILALSVIAFAVGLLRAMAPAEIFLAAVALAVGAIPEGLPVVFTVSLALGVRRMARRKAIIRSLPAVETLGSTTVIGSDKTGTLTENRMTVDAIWSAGRRYDRIRGAAARSEAGGDLFHCDGEPAVPDDHPGLRSTLLAGILANETREHGADSGTHRGDPTELALVAAAEEVGLALVEARRLYPEIDTLPFESDLRFMATLNDGPSGRRVWMKGAPEVVLARCDRWLGPEGEEPIPVEELDRASARLAREGKRVLAMAYREGSFEALGEEALAGGFVCAGLVGMEDPPRPEAIEAVRAAREAGIHVLMLTGDHVDTARAIGRRLGLGGPEARAVEGREIERMSDEDLDRTLNEVAIYGRVTPEHKLRVVQRLKARGEIVAVTGDGINDAPALRAAHIGTAMGVAGTDVAREVADMVLADDNFATITAAVEEGRLVFSNLRKVTFFLLCTGAGEILAILGALSAGLPLVLLPAQILWVNLVANGLQDVALAFEPREAGLLRRPPRAPGENILSLRLLGRLGAVGVVFAAGTLAVFLWEWQAGGDLARARTLALTQLVVFQFFHVFNCRSLDRSIFSIPLFSNRFLFVAIVAAAIAQVAVLYVPFLRYVFHTTPLAPSDWAWILLLGATVVVGGEIDKWWNRRRVEPLG